MRRWIVFLAVVTVSAILAGCAVTRRCDSDAIELGFTLGERPETDVKAVAEVPFRLIDDHIVIPVTVNRALEIDMVLDTGWGSPGAILVDPDLGGRLGLSYVTVVDVGGGGGDEASRKVGVAVGLTLGVSKLEFTAQQVMVLEESGVFEGWYADGIIGATLFEHVVRIDYERSVLSLYDSLPGKPDDFGQEFELDYSFGIPVVSASVMMGDEQTVPVTLLVDTGVNDPLLLFAFSNDRLVNHGPMIEGAEGLLSEGMTGRIFGSSGRVERLVLGPYRIDDVVASFPEEGSWGPAMQLGQNGMLGNEVLQRFHVVFDYGKKRMLLKPNSRYAAAFEYNMAGLILRGMKDGFEVLDVIADSPAWVQGIRGGDHLLAVNGRPVGDYDPVHIGRIFTDDGETLKLTLERDGERFTRSVALRRLI